MSLKRTFALYIVFKLTEIILQFVLLYIASKFMFDDAVFAITFTVDCFALIINLLVTIASMIEKIRTLCLELYVCYIFGGLYTLLLLFHVLSFEDVFRRSKNITEYQKQHIPNHESSQIGIKSLMTKENNTSVSKTIQIRDLLTEVILTVILIVLQIVSCWALKFYLKSRQTNQPEYESFENTSFNSETVVLEVLNFQSNNKQSCVVSRNGSEDPSRNMNKSERETSSVDSSSSEVAIFNAIDDHQRLVVTNKNSRDSSKNLSNCEEISSNDSDSSELEAFNPLPDDRQDLIVCSKKSKSFFRDMGKSREEDSKDNDREVMNILKESFKEVEKKKKTEEPSDRLLNLTEANNRNVEERGKKLLPMVEKLNISSSKNVKSTENATDCINGKSPKPFPKDPKKTEKRVRFDSSALWFEAVEGLEEIGGKTVISYDDKDTEGAKK